MLKAMRRFKPAMGKNFILGCFLTGILCAGILFVLPGQAEAGAKIKKNDTGLYRDLWDQNMYYEFTNFLHLERLWAKLFNQKFRAANVNVYDEVPDSSFFTNRHARKRLSTRELEQGYRETDGPDLSGNLKVISGKFEGIHPGFFVEDGRGDKYLIKFDTMDNLELETASEVIASRFYHAIGYNVPQYTIVNFASDRLVPGADAKIVDDTGFKKKLTLDRLDEYLLFIPQDAKGNYRASVSKLLDGENIGYFSFQQRRRDDPNDKINHQELREVRALRVFASWLNNYDVRASNSLDMMINENGEEIVKHYLIDFNASLGGGADYPMFTFEHIMDYGEATKAFFTLGLWEKPWQKRWKEIGEQNTQSPAVGNFDNLYFKPDKFKTQLPYYAFKDLTRSDAFWAAKIIMTFTDEDIRSMVRAGELSESGDADYIADVLSERRDLIGKYWFSQVNPLDAIDLKAGSLVFEDLAVTHGFEKASGASYHAEIYDKKGRKYKKLDTVVSREPQIRLPSEHEKLCISLRTSRGGVSEAAGPAVYVKVKDGRISYIAHED